MRAVGRETPQAAAPRKGPRPGPSKLAYRLHRAWAREGLRRLVTVYLPLAALGLVGWRVVSDDGLRVAAQEHLARAWETVAARPEFAVEGIVVSGGTGVLRARVRREIGPVAGLSSLTLDLGELRARVEAIGAVRRAELRFDTTGQLAVAIEAREPVALWRDGTGALALIDREGVRIDRVAARADHPDLPLVLGEGAERAVAEALALLEASPALKPRLRGLVRVGERRWDIVLDQGLTILLPEEGAVAALERALLVHARERLFDAHLAAVDLRVPGRPTLRLAPDAAEGLILERALTEVLEEET